MILFKYWKRKKDIPKEAFTLKSYKEQLFEYYKNNDWKVNKSDIDSIVYQEIKEKLSINEINDIISDLLILKPLNYEIVLEKLNTESYFWRSRYSSCLKDEIDIARKSLNIGDFIAYLVGKKYGIYNLSKTNDFLNLKPLIQEIELLIIQNIAELEQIWEQMNVIPLEKAHYIFFLQPKKVAIDIFSSIKRQETNRSNNPTFDFGALLISSRFFDRLNLDFIPYIHHKNYNTENLLFNANNEFIKKEELFNIIDNQDFFNNKRPLESFDKRMLINPKSDIKDIDEFKRILHCFFERIILKQRMDVADLFYCNITIADLGRIEKSNLDLIYARETLRTAFFEKGGKLKNEYLEFCSLINYLHGEIIYNQTKKLPYIIEAYFGEIAKSSTFHQYCFRKGENVPNDVLKSRKEISTWMTSII